MNELEKQYSDAIIETLQAVLSAEKVLIDKGQQQLTVLESRQGKERTCFLSFEWFVPFI
jgi:uncharacterized coiled-coil protein SlyX